MSRAANLLLVLICWAAIYLPGLGSLEIKGEEGRRILPAVTMLETGNWLVPQVGGEPYYRKPPLVNWLVALSFYITGHRNEWTARLPSVLSVLAVALAFVTVARASLGANGSLVAALIWMVNFGMIEKGRLIEIEALYVSLLGLAMICWLHWYHQQKSPWLIWMVPSVFLGLGMLAKGPVHLLFFYAVVLAVLYRAQARYSDAERLCLRALSLREKEFGPGHPEIAKILTNLADLYTRQRHHAKAEAVLRRALGLCEWVGRATIDALQLNRRVLVQARRVWAQYGLHPPQRRPLRVE